MKHLLFIAMLLPFAASAQNEMIFTIDSKGKMTFDKSSANNLGKCKNGRCKCKKGKCTYKRYQINLPNTPASTEGIPYFEEYYHMLMLQPMNSLKGKNQNWFSEGNVTEFGKNITEAQQEVETAYLTARKDTAYIIKDKKTLDIIGSTTYGKPESVSIKFQEHPEILVFKPNKMNNVLKEHYSNISEADLKKIKEGWLLLAKIERDIWAAKEEIYTYFQVLHTGVDSGLLADIMNHYHAVSFAINDFNTNYTDDLDKWLIHWAGVTAPAWTINPLGITDLTTVPYLGDTAALKHSIDYINSIIQLEGPAEDIYYNGLRRQNMIAHLEKLRSYKQQFDQSAVLKKKFTENTIITKIDLGKRVNHYRIHNAANNFELVNEDVVKKSFYYDTDTVGVFTYNIPTDAVLNIDAVSVGFYEVPQGSRVLGNIVDGIITGTGVMFEKTKEIFLINGSIDLAEAKGVIDTNEVKNAYSIVNMLDSLEDWHVKINNYTAALPPAIKLEYADDMEDGYKTELLVIGPHDKDSAVKTTYTMSTQKTGKEDPAKDKKEFTFTYKAYKKWRVQFAAGMHWFAGSAPVVEREGNSFKISSDNSFRYSAGLKVYPIRQTFADIKRGRRKEVLPNEHQFFHRLIRSAHVIGLVDLQKPLHNLYIGAGLDILPGLGVECGPHFYRYTAYQLYNDEVVSERNVYALRNGVHFCVSVDGSVLKKVISSFIK